MTKSQLDQVEKWLIEESQQTGEGFYCNWNIIKRAYEERRMMVIVKDNCCVGFAIWQPHEANARIDIFEIKPSEQKKGLGRQLDNKLLSHLLATGSLVVDLECVPAESEPVWRELGFIDFPVSLNSPRENILLYKILTTTIPPAVNNHYGDAIALWSNEPHRARNTDPSGIWPLQFKEGTRTLIQPIIHPAHRDWQIGWRTNGIPWQTKKMKYFNNGNSYNDQFLIITAIEDGDMT